MNLHLAFVRSCRQLGSLLALLLIATATQASTVTTGFLTINPWLDNAPGGDGWNFNSPWQFDGGINSGAALFVTDSSNAPGFYAAEASSVDLTTQANVLALDGYDPATTELTGLTFHDPWRIAHFGSVPADGEYNYFIEFTIDTPGGFYRAATQKIDRATAFQNFPTQLGFNFTWQGGGFLGDPFAGGNGIPLDQISDIDYNVFIEVISPTSAGSGFFLMEGINVEYEVTSNPAAIPEPSSLTVLALGGLLAGTLRSRKR